MSIEEVYNINLFIEGDNEAFTWIYYKHIHEIIAYGIGLGYMKNEIEDAIQDVCYNILKNRNSLIGVKNVKFFLLRSLKNRLINIKRDEKKTLSSDGFENIFFEKANIIENIIKRESKLKIEKRVNTLFKLLTPRQKEAIYLKYIQGLDYKEIAIILNMTIPSVRNLVSRGISKMRNELN